MPKSKIKRYKKEIKQAVDLFWNTRSKQSSSRKKEDQGNRSSVTGGKHLDGFVKLMKKVAIDQGVPQHNIYTKGNALPGYFRPTKDWDLVIINSKQQLVVAIEFKSQVGSFGNNFNNRTEEVLGNALDLWTAYRERGYPQKSPPWLGYLILVEKSKKSTTPVRIKEPHFKVREEFRNTSYLDRYKLLCEKLMLEKHYNAAAIIWSDSSKKHGNIDPELSLDSFIQSYAGFLTGKLGKF